MRLSTTEDAEDTEGLFVTRVLRVHRVLRSG
jgi:hypothetical protein